MDARVIAIPALAFALAAIEPLPAAAQGSPEQPARPTRLQASFSGVVGAGVGDFGNNVGMSGGVVGGLDFGLGASPVSVGGEVGYILYGMDSRKVDLGPAIPELAGTLVNVDRDNAMLLVHGRIRVQPRHGRWRPYADALLGLNYIFTTTSIDQGTCVSYGTYGSSCPSIDTTNLGDAVPSYGGGAGVMVRLGRSPSAMMLDVSARYLRGGEANYLRKGAIHTESGAVVLDVSRSRVDVLMVTVGLAFGR